MSQRRLPLYRPRRCLQLAVMPDVDRPLRLCCFRVGSCGLGTDSAVVCILPQFALAVGRWQPTGADNDARRPNVVHA